MHRCLVYWCHIIFYAYVAGLAAIYMVEHWERPRLVKVGSNLYYNILLCYSKHLYKPERRE